MAITSGDFTASNLAAVQLKMDNMWQDEMIKADFEADVDTFKALKKEQNANVSILQEPEKDKSVKIHWVNLCGETATDGDGDDCAPGGNELGSDSATYALNASKHWGFTVDEMTFRTNALTMEGVVAKGFLKADKILSEAITNAGLAHIEANKGTNVVTDGAGTWNATTTETDVAAADWNERLFAYMYRVGIRNKLSNPFLLSGSNLFEDWVVAKSSQGNANGKGAANLYKMIRTYFDLMNIDTANTPDLKTYLIQRGSIAFASKAYYGAVPTTYLGAGQQRYSIASRNLPGLKYDVIYTNSCDSNGNTIKHKFKVKTKYGWFQNPTGCDGTRTGVLAFKRTA